MSVSLSLPWTLGVALPVAVICWTIYQRCIRPRRSVFESDDVALEMDFADQVLRVRRRHALEATLKLGRCHIAFQHETTATDKGTPRRICRALIYELDLPDHFHKQWAKHPNTLLKTTKSQVTSFTTRNDAMALQRWVHAHRNTLFPNEHAIRQAWQQSCERLLTACRQVTMIQKLKTPLELFDYTPTPAIRYLAIGEDGRACLKALECTKVHELDLRNLQLDRFRLWVKLSNGKKERFTLNGSQLAHFCRIRQGWRNRYGLLPEYETQLLMRRSLASALTGIRQYAGVGHVPA